MQDTDLAWLAGLWDGEGSVGVSISRSTGREIYIPSIQINMTHRTTLERAAEILAAMYGCSVRLHVIKPPDPARHRESYYFALRRTTLLHSVAAGMLPFSVTKRLHWELIRDICAERIARCGGSDTDSGSLKRGGIAADRAPYTEREHQLCTQLRQANMSANNRSKTRMEASEQ